MVNETLIKDGAAIASKNLSPGEAFLSLPLIIEGPGCMKKPVCLGCLNPVSKVKRGKKIWYSTFSLLCLFRAVFRNFLHVPSVAGQFAQPIAVKSATIHRYVKTKCDDHIFIVWSSLFPEQTFERDRNENFTYFVLFFEEY